VCGKEREKEIERESRWGKKEEWSLGRGGTDLVVKFSVLIR
jgi:hypothetical protein